MGGIVSGIGDLIGGVGGAIGGVANAIPGIGPYVGPVIGGITGGPVGFASSLAGNALQGNYGGGGGGGGGGGTPSYAKPGINYGNQTYQMGNAPIDASNYFITGDKGVYNLLPALGQVNAGTNRMQYSPSRGGGDLDRRIDRFNSIGAANAYTPYEAYQDIRTQMANDPTALAAFNKAYSPNTFNSPKTDPNSPLGQFNTNNPNPYGNQFVNFGTNKAVPGQTDLYYDSLAKYAAENKNPFFLPFETTKGATPLGFTPSQNSLAAINTSDYINKFSTANTAQEKYIRDQERATKAAAEAQEQARDQTRDQARQAEDQARRAQQQARDQARDQRQILGFQGPRQNMGSTPVRPPATPNPMTSASTPVRPPVTPMGGLAALRRR